MLPPRRGLVIVPAPMTDMTHKHECPCGCGTATRCLTAPALPDETSCHGGAYASHRHFLDHHRKAKEERE